MQPKGLGSATYAMHKGLLYRILPQRIGDPAKVTTRSTPLGEMLLYDFQ
jgi:hypothetical protein